MPTLPVSLPVVPGGDQPIASTEDVLAILPPEARQRPDAPVRDALVTLVTDTALAWQVKSAQAAANADVTRAVSIYLDGLLGDRGIHRAEGEADEAYRARALSSPELVAPGVIIQAVNTVLAPYTDVKAQLFPCILDQTYLHQGDGTWHNFIWDATTVGTAGADPDYADRYYDDRTQAHPDAAWVFDNYLLGRGFLLRVPLLSNLSPEGAYLNDGTVQPDDGYAGDGSDTSGSEADGSIGLFVYLSESDAMGVYAQVVSAVESLRGHGIRWMLYVDPNLEWTA